MFSVGIFVVHGFDPWQCGEFLRIVPQKNFPCMCTERILETGHAHTHTHTHTSHFLSVIPNLTAAHPTLFVCSSSFNTFTAALHAG